MLTPEREADLRKRASLDCKDLLAEIDRLRIERYELAEALRSYVGPAMPSGHEARAASITSSMARIVGGSKVLAKRS